MKQNKCTSINCRQQEVNSAGFFVDSSLQDFYIKSNGKVIKHFQGRILVPTHEVSFAQKIKMYALKVATPKR